MSVESEDGVVGKLSLSESKLSRLSEHEDFLGFLKPDFHTLALTEATLDHEYPREVADEDQTRIFINYTNDRGNHISFKMLDKERLNRIFNIDDFINGYFASVNAPAEGVGEYSNYIGLIRPTLVTALNTAVVNAIRVSNEKISESVRNISEVIVFSLVSILLNDPLDAIILVKQDNSNAEGSSITGVWTVKRRN